MGEGCEAEPLIQRARRRKACGMISMLTLSLSLSATGALRPRHGMNSYCHGLERSSALVAVSCTQPRAHRLSLGITVSYSGHSGVSAFALVWLRCMIWL